VSELAEQIEALGRYDGVGLRNGEDTVASVPRRRAAAVGPVRTTVRVVR
jgi:hypothetical protein